MEKKTRLIILALFIFFWCGLLAFSAYSQKEIDKAHEGKTPITIEGEGESMNIRDVSPNKPDILQPEIVKELNLEKALKDMLTDSFLNIKDKTKEDIHFTFQGISPNSLEVFNLLNKEGL